MVAALDRMVLPVVMGAGAVAPYFSWNLDCRCVQVQFGRLGAAQLLIFHIVQAVTVVPAEISSPLLVAGE